jgi:hypothetical protein
VHAAKHEFVLHFDVDLIYGEEFPWTNLPGTGGLSLSEVREALCVFASQPNLAAFEIAGYNPDLDPDGKGAQTLIELLATVLSKRLDALTGRTDQGAEAAGSASAAAVGASGSGSATVTQRDVPESLSSLAAGDFSGTSEPEPRDS